MPAHKQFKAWLICDKEIMEEYGTNMNDNKREMTTWVASEPGMAFSVHLQIDDIRAATLYRDDEHIHVLVHIDGVEVGDLATTSSFKSNGVLDFDCASVGPTGSESRKLIFSGIPLIDDETATWQGGSDTLGTITITMTRICYVTRKEKKEKKPYSTANATFSDQPLYERDAKILSGVTHRVSLGETVRGGGGGVDGVSKCSQPCRVRPGNFTPFFTFKFRYRSLAHLQAQGIAPAPPTDDDSDDETLGERSTSPLTSLSGSDNERPHKRPRHSTENEVKEEPQEHCMDNPVPDDTGILKSRDTSKDVKEGPQEAPGEQPQEQACHPGSKNVKEEPQKDQIDDAVLNEIRFLKERLQQLEEKIQQPKNSSALRIKFEAPPANLKPVRGQGSGAVIDLTDD